MDGPSSSSSSKGANSHERARKTINGTDLNTQNSKRPSVSDLRFASGSSNGGRKYGSSSSLGKRNAVNNYEHDLPDTQEYQHKQGQSGDYNSFSQSFGRESLVDNLLLSFDRLGQDLQVESRETHYYQTTHDRTARTDYEDEENEEHLRRDSDFSKGYNKQPYGASTGRKYSDINHNQRLTHNDSHNPRALQSFGSIDFGRTEEYSDHADVVDRGNGTAEAGRVTDTSTMKDFSNGTYDAAPTPTISNRARTRDSPSHTATSERVPPARIERRRSIKSNKSNRRMRDDLIEDPLALPPLPLHDISPNIPPVINKPTARPGFFRRVFGGGGSGGGSGGTGGAAIKNATPPVPASNGSSSHVNTMSPPPTAATKPSPVPDAAARQGPPVVAKKSSGFFRRRKKSMSDIEAYPVPKVPSHVQNQSIDGDSIMTSLKNGLEQISSQAAIRDDHPQDELHDNSRPPSRSNSIRRATPSDVERTIMTASSASGGNNDESNSKRPTIRAVASSDFRPFRNHSYEDQAYSNDVKGKAPMNHKTYSQTPPRLKTQDLPEVKALQSMAENTSNIRASPVTPVQRHPYSSRSYIGKPAAQYENVIDDNQKFENETNVVDAVKDAIANKSSNQEQTSPKTPSLVVSPSNQDYEGMDDTTPRANRNIDLKPDQFEPRPDEKVWAKKIFDGDEDFIPKARAAAWLGESDESSMRTRQAYMALYDWTSVNVLAALRMLCGQLILKGETQQVDRLVAAIARRWCICNPNHGFKTADVIHTILYSLLLLNTDLHLADIPNSSKMTKSQFVKNTVATIRRGLHDEAEDEIAGTNGSHNRALYEFDEGDKENDSSNFLSSVKDKGKTLEPKASFDQPRPNRLSFMRATNSMPRLFDDSSEAFGGSATVNMDGNGQGGENGGPLINAPFLGTMKQWENTVEMILKDFYYSVKATALPLHGFHDFVRENSNNLSVNGNQIRRTPSTISRTPSEQSSRTTDQYGSMVRGARNDSVGKLSSRWNPKTKSRPKLYTGSFAGSSRTSFDDRMWSPSASSVWSKYSLDKTATSMMSMESLGSGFGHNDYMQSIGFANALSNAIIREEAASIFTSNDGTESIQPTVLDDDIEDLALHGAPWAKEGLVKHKHHLEAADKKAKNRGWTECFGVIEKGWMRLFLFPSSDSKKKAPKSNGLVGGGNWMENAEPIGNFMLRQTIASALPPPGYSKNRPNVLALSLPNGAVHLFQAGTPEIVKEWVTTANYWSARLSKEPLVGGVSNIEYGWGNVIDYDGSSPPSTGQGGPRPSFQESIRSSMDHGSGVRAKLPGDRAVITEWNPPTQSMMASPLCESDQLAALTNYVSKIEIELQKHNELRGPMILAFSSRHPNHGKAMNNWERKSSYLLREIIKFRTYIDCLTAAGAQREKLLSEKAREENE